MHEDYQVLADTCVRNRKQIPPDQESNPGPTALKLCALTTLLADGLTVLDHM